jgi:C4-dicarboxylate-specific signal transduction histidine kinase
MVLALRAELLQTLTPGLMHDLSNAGQGLVAASSYPQALQQVAQRLERARRVVATLVSDLAAAETTALDPSASVEEILAEVEAWQSYQITLPRVRVVFDPHPPLPAARIRGDHLRDALAAIVTNAKEAMAVAPQGEVRVSSAADAEWITITVEDEGPGINLTTMARLFEPYNSTKKGGRHLGLGLSVARELLARAGGDLNVSTSEEQPHTRIRMRIPVHARRTGSGSGEETASARDAAAGSGKGPSGVAGQFKAAA